MCCVVEMQSCVFFSRWCARAGLPRTQEVVVCRIVPCRFSFGEGMGGGGLVVAGFAQRVAEPFQPLVQPVSRGGAGGLDVLTHTYVSRCTSQSNKHIEEEG